MATEAAVSNSAEDVSNLPNEDEQIFPIRTEKIEDNVETIEDVTVTVCHDDDGATEKADVTATVCNDDNDDDGATTEKEVVDENTTPNDGAATEKKEDENTTEEEDYSHLSKQDEQLSPILSWTTEDVAEWITKLGFPFYKNCFICNGIDGRKLILCNTSTLCKLGIADFKHLKFIAKEVRDLLKIGEPNWNVSIADIPRDIKEAMKTYRLLESLQRPLVGINVQIDKVIFNQEMENQTLKLLFNNRGSRIFHLNYKKLK